MDLKYTYFKGNRFVYTCLKTFEENNYFVFWESNLSIVCADDLLS